MKQSELIPCNIGTADLMHEFIDILFDDAEFIDEYGIVIGLINHEPVHLTYRGGTNRITVKYGDVDNVLSKVHDILNECDRENPDPEYRHIAKRVDNEITIWYEPIKK